MGPNRTKVVTPNSSLKFTPEELVLYCRDLRVVCFLFDRLTPDSQVIEVSVFLFLLQLQQWKKLHLLVCNAFLYLPDVVPPDAWADSKLLLADPTLWGVEVKIILPVISLSDNLHYRQDLPASQSGRRFIFPECRSGECRWVDCCRFLKEYYSMLFSGLLGRCGNESDLFCLCFWSSSSRHRMSAKLINYTLLFFMSSVSVSFRLSTIW